MNERTDERKGKIIMKNGLIVDQFETKQWYKWYKDDLLHRTDGPALVCSDGYEAWYFEGQLHRTDGPAIIHSDGSKLWYFENRIHRTDGPAVINSDGSEYWWLNDKHLTHHDWLVAVASTISIIPVVSSSIAVNDHTCPTCKNDHCSKTEKSCWKCGSNL
jgi:hypothetical protein